jgi:Tol biopolymer transport system component
MRARSRSTRFASSVAVAACAAAAVAASAGATFPGRNGYIAILQGQTRASGKSGLYAIRPDGSHRRKLGAAHCRRSGRRVLIPNDASYSGSGTRVAFASYGCPDGHAGLISVMHADGSHKRIVLHGNRDVDGHVEDPAFSPSGGRIAFVASRYAVGHKGEQQLMTVRSDGTDGLPFMRHDPEYDPDWSPNGRRIAFSALDRGGRNGFAVYTVAPNGTHLRRLASASRSDFGQPHYSPDGRRIVFVGGKGIETMWTDGTHVRTLRAMKGASEPTYSPNGAKIVFNRFRTLRRGLQVCVIDADGGHPRVIAHGAWARSWQPRP